MFFAVQNYCSRLIEMLIKIQYNFLYQGEFRSIPVSKASMKVTTFFEVVANGADFADIVMEQRKVRNNKNIKCFNT